MIAETGASKVYVDERTEWLFICGRDVFKRGVKKTTGIAGRGDYTLVVNLRGECLGFGQFLVDSTEEREGVAVQNLLDLRFSQKRKKAVKMISDANDSFLRPLAILRFPCVSRFSWRTRTFI